MNDGQTKSPVFLFSLVITTLKRLTAGINRVHMLRVEQTHDADYANSTRGLVDGRQMVAVDLTSLQ